MTSLNGVRKRRLTAKETSIGVFCCAIDLDFLHTESSGESKDDSKGEVDASK